MKDLLYIIPRALFWMVAGYLVLSFAFQCGAYADSVHEKAFGDRAWIADLLKEEYLSASAAAGPNLGSIPLAYREYFLRSEIAWTGCLVTYHVTTGMTPREIQSFCADPKTAKQWLIYLNRAMVRTKRFPPEYGGQTALAFMNVQAVHVVMRHIIRSATADDAKRGLLFERYAAPELVRQLDKLEAAQRQLTKGD